MLLKNWRKLTSSKDSKSRGEGWRNPIFIVFLLFSRCGIAVKKLKGKMKKQGGGGINVMTLKIFDKVWQPPHIFPNIKKHLSANPYKPESGIGVANGGRHNFKQCPKYFWAGLKLSAGGLRFLNQPAPPPSKNKRFGIMYSIYATEKILPITHIFKFGGYLSCDWKFAASAELNWSIELLIIFKDSRARKKMSFRSVLTPPFLKNTHSSLHLQIRVSFGSFFQSCIFGVQPKGLIFKRSSQPDFVACDTHINVFIRSLLWNSRPLLSWPRLNPLVRNCLASSPPQINMKTLLRTQLATRHTFFSRSFFELKCCFARGCLVSPREMTYLCYRNDEDGHLPSSLGNFDGHLHPSRDTCSVLPVIDGVEGIQLFDSGQPITLSSGQHHLSGCAPATICKATVHSPRLVYGQGGSFCTPEAPLSLLPSCMGFAYSYLFVPPYELWVGEWLQNLMRVKVGGRSITQICYLLFIILQCRARSSSLRGCRSMNFTDHHSTPDRNSVDFSHLRLRPGDPRLTTNVRGVHYFYEEILDIEFPSASLTGVAFCLDRSCPQFLRIN
ncbi:hypothetical protein VP01_2044g1 [Puccinia sorghi]|uniref:Uncharacterized protein n=1 Tax=Puccinia sorghi TaxID=27349 RepID=A0A0L6VAU1_9BASI|nr:hypothetical protein VP01_2044g1 [Puccinia sorghi]